MTSVASTPQHHCEGISSAGGRIAHIVRRFMRLSGGSRTATAPSASDAVMRLSVPPQMSFDAYVQRLIDYMNCTPECFVIATVFTMHLVTSGAVHLNQHTTHRVFGACLVLAIKTRDDHFHNMSHYARVVGVPVADLNKMELFVLKALDFRTHVDPEDYALMVEAMIEVDTRGDNSWHNYMAVPHAHLQACVLA